MTNALIPEYSSVEQLCEKWRYDKNQLKHAIEKYKIGLWICIENTKNIFDMNLSVFDEQTCKLEPLPNPFGPKVLPMSPV